MMQKAGWVEEQSDWKWGIGAQRPVRCGPERENELHIISHL
jgi:hypothetical protein